MYGDNAFKSLQIIILMICICVYHFCCCFQIYPYSVPRQAATHLCQINNWLVIELATFMISSYRAHDSIEWIFKKGIPDTSNSMCLKDCNFLFIKWYKFKIFA